MYVKKLKKKQIVVFFFALFSAFVLTIGHFVFYGNDSIFFYGLVEYASQMIKPDSTQVESDELYINVAYDKQLIEVYDQFGMPKGVSDITDRGKLNQLLTLLKESDQYKYIILDVRFEKGYASESDSALFATIKSTPRLVASHHYGMEVEDSTILSKTALSDYNTDIDVGHFTRYKLIQHGERSTPLHVYEEITHKKAKAFYKLIEIDGKLLELSPFIQFSSIFDSKYDEDGNYKYYEMGVDILDQMSAEDISTLTKEKFVVVGNLIDDVHDTYVGQQPGSFIIMQTIKALLENKPMENPFGVLAMALVYILLICAMFGARPLWQYIPIVRRVKNGALSLLFSFLGYSIILFICTTVMYLACGKVYNTLLPSAYLSVVSAVVSNFGQIKEISLIKKILNKRGKK